MTVTAISDNYANEVGQQNAHLLVPGILAFITGHFIWRNRDLVRAFQYLVVANHTIEVASRRRVVQIAALNDKSLEIKKAINIEISWDDDGIIATFPQAEIVTSGDTALDAIDWMKDTIAANFKLFSSERGALGPLPERQLAALEEFVGQKQTGKERRA